MTNLDHRKIDARLLRLVEATVELLDREPALLSRLADNVGRWTDARLRADWDRRLRLPWPELRALLLAETDAGAALRQNAPLGGILPAADRTRLMRQFAHDARAA